MSDETITIQWDEEAQVFVSRWPLYDVVSQGVTPMAAKMAVYSAALLKVVEENTNLRKHASMKMYVWGHEGFSVVAYANSVDQARGLALSELAEKPLVSGVREKIRRAIESEVPASWLGTNAEVYLRNSMEVEELREEIDVLTAKLTQKELELRSWRTKKASTVKTVIPGLKAKHAVVTPTCRASKGTQVALGEALDRLWDEYSLCCTFEANRNASYHFVLTIERPSPGEGDS